MFIGSIGLSEGDRVYQGMIDMISQEDDHGKKVLKFYEEHGTKDRSSW